MNKALTYILVVVILLLLGVCYYQYRNPKIVYKETLVDSIELKIDTVYQQIDSLEKVVYVKEDKIKKIENEYKKDLSTIVDESILEDVKFFTGYLISQDNRGLFDYNTTDTVKTN